MSHKSSFSQDGTFQHRLPRAAFSKAQRVPAPWPGCSALTDLMYSATRGAWSQGNILHTPLKLQWSYVFLVFKRILRQPRVHIKPHNSLQICLIYPSDSPNWSPFLVSRCQCSFTPLNNLLSSSSFTFDNIVKMDALVQFIFY